MNISFKSIKIEINKKQINAAIANNGSLNTPFAPVSAETPIHEQIVDIAALPPPSPSPSTPVNDICFLIYLRIVKIKTNSRIQWNLYCRSKVICH